MSKCQLLLAMEFLKGDCLQMNLLITVIIKTCKLSSWRAVANIIKLFSIIYATIGIVLYDFD
jgi:hypothetical protein